jgi:spore coat polysaccharide biosynthesis protein SpsF
MPPRVVAIIQARMGSTRLPGKTLMPIQGKPLLHQILDRILDAETVTHIVVATTTSDRDDVLVEAVKNYHPKISVFRGSEEDVLDRYYQAAKEAKADIVLRLTADDPFKDPEVIDQVVRPLLDDPSLEYCSNILGEQTFPNGLDVEAMRFSVMEKMATTAMEQEDREHVTLMLRKNPEGFATKNITLPQNLHYLRWTIDEDRDFEMAKRVYASLYPTNPKFRMRDILALIEKEPEIATVNQDVKQKLAQF